MLKSYLFTKYILDDIKKWSADKSSFSNEELLKIKISDSKIKSVTYELEFHIKNSDKTLENTYKFYIPRQGDLISYVRFSHPILEHSLIFNEQKSRQYIETTKIIKFEDPIILILLGFTSVFIQFTPVDNVDSVYVGYYLMNTDSWKNFDVYSVTSYKEMFITYDPPNYMHDRIECVNLLDKLRLFCN